MANSSTSKKAKPNFAVPGPLGDYLILTKLNRGGMADVYLAQHLSRNDCWVAVKSLLPSLLAQKRYVEMFTSEGQLGKLLKHEHIAETWDVGSLQTERGPVHFLAMEYVHGRDLGAVLRVFRREGRQMPIPQALYVITCVLSGLSYAHALSDSSGAPLHLVNRDISPGCGVRIISRPGC